MTAPPGGFRTLIVTQATQNTRLLAYFSAFPGSQNPAGAAAQDLSEVAGRPRGGRGKPPFGYLLAPPLLTDTTAVTGDSQWLLRLFTRDVHTWGTRVYPQLAQITPSAPTCRGSAVGAASARLGITSVPQLTTRGRKRRADGRHLQPAAWS